jgi:septal ring factor EnvC (AmiA/AmiB activator)
MLKLAPVERDIQLGKKPHKSFPDESEKKKIRAQSAQIKFLEKEIRRLKQELATLNAAFKKSADYMSDESGPISVEKLIRDANKHKPLVESKKDLPTIDEKEAVRRKWDIWNRNRIKGGNNEED